MKGLKSEQNKVFNESSIINITEKNYPKTLKRRQVMLPNKSDVFCSLDFNF